jgi:hypothetical protein
MVDGACPKKFVFYPNQCFKPRQGPDFSGPGEQFRPLFGLRRGLFWLTAFSVARAGPAERLETLLQTALGTAVAHHLAAMLLYVFSFDLDAKTIVNLDYVDVAAFLFHESTPYKIIFVLCSAMDS